MNARLAIPKSHAQGAFSRLAQLLQDVAPATGLTPIAMHLGEIQASPARQLLAPLGEAEPWTHYPPLGGTAALRDAYRGWLARRFRTVPADGLAVEPTAGTKQAVAALIGLAAHARRPARAAVVAVPDPYYPTYRFATEEASARCAYYDPAPARVLASLRKLLANVGDDLCALVLCHPCSPSGEVYGPALLAQIAAFAARHGLELLVDECYIDSYVGAPPPGFLELEASHALPASGWVVLHSLSKRCGVPGLRSGFLSGDPRLVEGYARFNRTCGVSSAWPICHTAARLWADDTHAQTLRLQLQGNLGAAERILGHMPGYRTPACGFYLWLQVEDDEAFARLAWERTALKLMPGSYLGGEGWGQARHVRVALVHEPKQTEIALHRLRNTLEWAAEAA